MKERERERERARASSGREREREKLVAIYLPAFRFSMKLAMEMPFLLSSQMHIQQLSASPWASHPAVLTLLQTPMKSIAHIHHFISTT